MNDFENVDDGSHAYENLFRDLEAHWEGTKDAMEYPCWLVSSEKFDIRLKRTVHAAVIWKYFGDLDSRKILDGG